MRPCVVLVPGFFGFRSFGTGEARIDYFARVERALRRTLDADFLHHDPSPYATGPLAKRVETLFRALVPLAAGGACVHLIGHSTGGVDAQLVLNPRFEWPGGPTSSERASVAAAVASVDAVSAPFFGTPIARRTTVLGPTAMVLLHLLSITTSAHDLRFAGGTLMLLSALLSRFGVGASANELFIQRFLSGVDATTAAEIRRFAGTVAADVGLLEDLVPERMADLQARIAGADPVPVRSWVTVAPTPRPAFRLETLEAVGRRGLYALAHSLTEPRTGEARPAPSGDWIGPATAGDLAGASDGIVPIGSQTPNGRAEGLVLGDHLDVVGHFEGEGGGGTFFKSGAGFDEACFEAFWDWVGRAIGKT